ncbi:MAG: outer membrane lipoprotein-sorting protein [Deltaproteobacteria bacterium]|nr:outer membrane lipoprotein-sorting protein [Deltaproteobacteria bacterium]
MWSLAFRNIRRDKRRSVTTMLAVGCGVFGLLLFLGYVRFVESTLSAVVIYKQGHGHVQVYRKGAIERLSSEPSQYSLTSDQAKRIAEVTRSLPGAQLVTPQLEGVGVIQNDERSTVFLASGVVPEDDGRLRALGTQAVGASMADGTQGAALRHGDAESHLLITKQLGEVLGVVPPKPDFDGYLQLSGIGFDQRLNALDAKIEGSFATGIEETESRSIKLPLQVLQNLYRTDSVSRLVVVLDDRARTAGFAKQLEAALGAAGLQDLEVTTWKHPAIGKLYESAMGFFSVVFSFTAVLVLLITVLAVQNTISIGVLDRLREIGTFRSIGFGKRQVSSLFAKEALVLAAVGAVAGSILAVIVSSALSAAGLSTTLPRMSTPVPVRLYPGIVAVVLLCLGGALVTAVVCFFAVKRRINRRIVQFFQLGAGAAGLVLAAAIVLGASPSLAQGAASPTPQTTVAPPTVEQVRDWIRFTDRSRGGHGAYSWNLTIVSVEPQGKTESRYDIDVKGNRAVAFTEYPTSSKGEAILIAGRGMWFMRPGLRKPLSVSPRQRLTGQAANGDIASVQYADSYRAVFQGEATVLNRPTYKVLLQATSKDVTYDQVIYYLDKETRLAIYAEFLTVSGKPFKVATMKYDNGVGQGKTRTPFISEMKISDAVYKDRVSTLTYRNIRPASHPDSHFSLTNLGQ